MAFISGLFMEYGLPQKATLKALDRVMYTQSRFEQLKLLAAEIVNVLIVMLFCKDFGILKEVK